MFAIVWAEKTTNFKTPKNNKYNAYALRGRYLLGVGCLVVPLFRCSDVPRIFLWAWVFSIIVVLI